MDQNQTLMTTYNKSKQEQTVAKKAEHEKLAWMKNAATIEEQIIMKGAQEDLHFYASELITQMNEKEKRMKALLSKLDDYESNYGDPDKKDLEMEEKTQRLLRPLNDVLKSMKWDVMQTIKTIVESKKAENPEHKQPRHGGSKKSEISRAPSVRSGSDKSTGL
jgi:hypothetical protein